MKEWFRLRLFPKRGGTSSTDAPAGLGKDHRGLTLLELIVAIALLGFVSSILLRFVHSSTALYRRISGELGLQVQSQLALAQLQEYVLDANRGLYFEDYGAGPILYVYNEERGNLVCHMFRLQDDNNILYYDKRGVTVGGTVPGFNDLTAVEMAANVTAFHVDINPASAAGELWTVAGVQISLDFALLGAQYKGLITLAPRSRPQSAATHGKLHQALTG